MTNSKFTFSLCIVLSVIFLCTGCLSKKEPAIKKEQVFTEIKKEVIQPQEIKKTYDLYSSSAYDLPLFSIVEISKLPNTIKIVVDKLLEASQGFYLLRKDDDKILIILQNPVNTSNTFSRHDLQFVEIDSDGKLTYHNAGYQGIEGETFNIIEQTNEEWLFDESTEPHKPLKHTVYNEKGKVKFTELWNYDETEPIKYQMKDSHKKVVSILKESQDNDSNLRKEHVFYDNEGNTKMSLTVNYDGANISRVTFYNAHESIDSISVISEYENGLKTKELIYNESYELINRIISEYIDGERKKIKVFNNEDILISEISS